MSNQWFRMYAEVLNDPKVQKLPDDLFKSWINILCLSCMNDGFLPEIKDIAFALRTDNNGAITVVERLLNATLIDRVNGGVNGYRHAPHGWGERQYKSDSSKERVKRYRERKRNVTVTPPEQNRTDTDKERKKEDSSKLVSPSDACEVSKSNFQKIYEEGSAIFPSLASANTSFIQQWISAGCVPELDAVPAIEAAHRAGTQVKSWKYFDGAVREAIERRKNPPKGNHHATEAVGQSRFQEYRPNKTERLKAAALRVAEAHGFASGPPGQAGADGDAVPVLSGAETLR